jgi:outer membrane protein TolC
VDITRFLGIGLTELLTWPWRSDIAQRDIDALRLQLARDVLAHNSEVRAAWVRAVAAQQLVIYHRQVQDAAAASAELARRMQAVGNFSRLQRAREQAFLADATTQLARAMAAATVEREALVRKLGLDAGDAEGLQLPERLPDLPAQTRHGDEVAQRAMNERLDLLLARAQLGAAQRATGLETVQLFDIELAAVSELGPGGERGRGFEAGIRLPLLDPGIALRQASSAKLLAAQNRFEQVRIEAGSVLRERYVLYRSAHDVARHQRDEVVPLKRSITDEMLLKYNGMLVGVFELLADARAQVGAVIAAIEAQRDFWLADAALNAAIVGAPSSATPMATATTTAERKGH